MRSSAIVGLAALTASLLGCASSPYDHAWVGREIKRAAGHAPGNATLEPSLPPGIANLSALGEGDAIAVALWNNAAFGVELAQLGASRADLAQAGALPNPILSFLLPIGPRQLEASLLFPLSALVERPFRVKAAKLDVERTARGLVQRGLDLARDVRLAWIEADAAKARVVVREDLAKTWVNVAKIAAARRDAGDAPPFESITAEADAQDAADQLERAKTDWAASKERLRLVLGLSESSLGANLGTNGAAIDEREPMDEGALLSLALAARPDVRAAEMSVEAAGERIGWEKTRVFAMLGRFDVKPIGSQGGPPLLPLPGAQFEIPIFNWNPGGIGRAEAELVAATLRYRQLRQTIATDVRVARLELVQALASLHRFREVVLPLLEKGQAIALSSFENGAEPYLVVLEATRRLRDARLRKIDLDAAVRRAWANLERHVGRRQDAP